MNQVYFVTGIDTNIGKSMATGYLAKLFMGQGKSVITQKFIQTGNYNFSEDISIHRKIMGIELQPVDKDRTTCPVLLSFPASPHLAAEIDGVSIDLKEIKHATALLKSLYDIVFIEGAGGVMVPIRNDYTTLDYIVEEKLPVIIVTSSKLGSINHTLLTLEVCRSRGVTIEMIVYNPYLSESEIIKNDTRKFIQKYMSINNIRTEWVELPEIKI